MKIKWGHDICTSCSMPKDGDQARPIEVLTNGLQSRRQCDREISYFLAPGTPVLCHDPSVKGSQLKAKSTWKVAVGMQDEQAVLWSPYTRMTSRSKSWTAFKLESGLSYTKFLKLQPEHTFWSFETRCHWHLICCICI